MQRLRVVFKVAGIYLFPVVIPAKAGIQEGGAEVVSGFPLFLARNRLIEIAYSELPQLTGSNRPEIL